MTMSFCCIFLIFFPLVEGARTIYGFLGTLVFSGFIVYDINQLIKEHAYNEYVVTPQLNKSGLGVTTRYVRTTRRAYERLK
jgi:FtsH-binding integral membrane protein